MLFPLAVTAAGVEVDTAPAPVGVDPVEGDVAVLEGITEDKVEELDVEVDVEKLLLEVELDVVVAECVAAEARIDVTSV